MKRIIVVAMLACTLATVGLAKAQEPTTTVTGLVIVDIQDFYFPGGLAPLVDPQPAAANAGRLLAWFREQGWPVAHVGHVTSQGAGFRPEVTPRAGEHVVHKTEVNSFKGTDLESWLRGRGVTRLVVCGMQTHMCAEAAARAAADLGFDVILAADACATRDLEYGGVTVPAAQVHAATLATIDRYYGKVMTTDDILEGALMGSGQVKQTNRD